MRLFLWMVVVLMPGATAWAGDLTGTPAVELDATEWINSPPLTLAALAGRPAVIYLWASMHPDCRKNAAMLNEVFKAYTAMTPYQYFIGIKIHKAKELLERGGSAIKEVAYRLGFKDEYYFSRLFKSKAGVSPSRWSGNPRSRACSAAAW